MHVSLCLLRHLTRICVCIFVPAAALKPATYLAPILQLIWHSSYTHLPPRELRAPMEGNDETLDELHRQLQEKKKQQNQSRDGVGRIAYPEHVQVGRSVSAVWRILILYFSGIYSWLCRRRLTTMRQRCSRVRKMLRRVLRCHVTQPTIVIRIAKSLEKSL